MKHKYNTMKQMEKHLHPIKIHENTGGDLIINENLVKKAHFKKVKKAHLENLR